MTDGPQTASLPCDHSAAYPLLWPDVDSPAAAREALRAVSEALTAVPEPLRPGLERLREDDVAQALHATPLTLRGHALSPLGISVAPRRVSSALCRDVVTRMRRAPRSPRTRHALRHLTAPIATRLKYEAEPADQRFGAESPPASWSPAIKQLAVWSSFFVSPWTVTVWQWALSHEWAVEGLDADAVAAVRTALDRSAMAFDAVELTGTGPPTPVKGTLHHPSDPTTAGGGTTSPQPARRCLKERNSAMPPETSEPEAVPSVPRNDAFPALREAATALLRLAEEAKEPARRIAHAVDGGSRPADDDVAAVERLTRAYDDALDGFRTSGLPVPPPRVEHVRSAFAETVARAEDEETRESLATVLGIRGPDTGPVGPLLAGAKAEAERLLGEDPWSSESRRRGRAMAALVELVRLQAHDTVSSAELSQANEQWLDCRPDLLPLALHVHVLEPPAAQTPGSPPPDTAATADATPSAAPADAPVGTTPAGTAVDTPGGESEITTVAAHGDARGSARSEPTAPPTQERPAGRPEPHPPADAGRPEDAPASEHPDTATAPPDESARQSDGSLRAASGATSRKDEHTDETPPHRASAAGPTATPWSDGAESPVARLIAETRLSDAYWLTRGSAEPALRAEVMAFAASAFTADGDTAASNVLMAYDLDAETVAEDREALLVALAASVRAGLTAGWPGGLITGFNSVPGLPPPWQDLMAALVDVVRQCRRLEPGALSLDSEPRVDLSRAEVGAEARRMLSELPMRTVKYQRATLVLQTLVAPEGALGKTLVRIAEWAEGGRDATVLHEEAERYRRSDAADRLIAEADRARRTPKQAREEIKAGALRQLQSVVASVKELLSRARNLAAASANPGMTSRMERDLLPVLRAVRTEAAPAGPGGAALDLLLRWLLGDVPATRRTSDAMAEEAALDDAGQGGTGPGGDPDSEHGSPYGTPDRRAAPSSDSLLVLPDIPRNSHGEPDVATPGWGTSLPRLLDPPDLRGAFEAYCERGDLHLAERLLELLEQNGLPHVQATGEQLRSFRRRLTEASGHWRERLRDRAGAVTSLLAEVRTLNLLDPVAEHDFTSRLQDLAQPDPAGRLGAALAELDQLKTRLTGLVDRRTAELLAELEQLRIDPAGRERIRRLIADGDSVTADEFLSFARRGEPLPQDSVAAADELSDFIEVLSRGDAPTPRKQGVRADWWAKAYATGTLTEGAVLGLDAWNALCDPNSRTGQWQRHVPQVLRLLGLECPAGGLTESARPTRGVMRLRARATTTEATAGYIAALGSRATTYTVVLISEEHRAPTGPLVHLEEADQEANIVLYLHPLGARGRRHLAETSRRRPQQALVVDPAVVGWMAARAPRSFRALQRVTLPWTGYNPYTPFVAGLVPPEVFYGRDEEMREVMDRDGRLFVYGGRQLGKSALLRRVADVFPQGNPDNVAIYMDLLKSEVGQAEPPARIWSSLLGRLEQRGVVPAKAGDHMDPGAVVEQIRRWLDENDDRRLLVLADEADAFLTADSRPQYTRGGQSTFPHFTKLQKLMEETERRFKIVFSGLHQVQRFGHLQNVVVVHGGPGILVGPLAPAAALQLVVEPMSALGYAFERPELVWRILATTNYQANLIQIFCSELIRALHARSTGPDSRAVTVTEHDVQSVAASETVRRRIAERLRFTINLEDRYRVLALIIALDSLEKGYSTTYSPKELLDRAREVWSEGFASLGVGQVRIYLEEMEGLGILIKLAEQQRFAVRSPNVVNMLGTREELGAELKESEFGLPYEYNPREARRLLGTDKEGVNRYSPLTEGQLHEALLRDDVTLVQASDLFVPEQILISAEAYARFRRVEVIRVQAHADDLPRQLAKAGRLRRPLLILADLRGAAPRVKEETLEGLTSFVGAANGGAPTGKDGQEQPHISATARRSVLVIADPATDTAAPTAAAVVRPERWTTDSLRSWPESPFGSLDERRALIRATGGWPHLVERAIAQVHGGATLDTALHRISELTDDPRLCEEHLRRSGMDVETRRRASVWNAYLSADEETTAAAITGVLETDHDTVHAHLEHLEALGLLEQSDNGVKLDPVTHRALMATGNPHEA